MGREWPVALGQNDSHLRALAFGDRPESVVPLGETSGSRWLAAVGLGGQGRYALAAGQLRELVYGPDPVLAALAGATLASHLRQLGGHAAARRWDALAVWRLAGLADQQGQVEPGQVEPGQVDPGQVDPDGVDLAGAWSDALLGLAADAVGLGEVGLARRMFAAAGRRAGPDPSWRVAVRTNWLAAEIELAAGQPEAAVAPAQAALDRARQAGAVRHTVKSTMVLGAALSAGGTPDGRQRAQGLLTEALAVSLDRGMFPLAWPCALLLAELVPDRAQDYRELAGNALTCVFDWAPAATQRIALASPWVPTGLIRSGDPTRTGGGLTT